MTPAGLPPARLAAIAVALAVTAAGCSSRPPTSITEPPPGPTSPASSSTPPASPSALPAVAPLTGRPATSGADARRTIVGIPVLTGEGRASPAGIDRADLLYLSFPTPQTQRILAVFQSQESDRVGPVAELRPMDGKLMAPLGGPLAHAGGSTGQLARIASAGVPHLSADTHPEAFSVTDTGLYTSTGRARSAGGRPALDGLVAFRAEEDRGTTAPPVSVSMPGHPPFVLRLDGAGAWTGTLHAIALRATNVVVQLVEHEVVEPGSGAAELDPGVIGTGAAFVLTGSRTTAATWRRPGRASVTNYIGADGNPIRLLPGVTIVLLAAQGTRVAPS